MTGEKLATITIDVEASRSRQSQSHVDRLIWGRFADHADVGIGRMMDIAERHGHVLSFFVDYCETFAYPNEFRAITKQIVERGHDLQLHAHQNWLAKDFFSSRGLPVAPALLNDYSQDQAHALLEFLVAEAVAGGAPTPVAFRGGSYQFGPGVLDAMSSLGLHISSNYNAAHASDRKAVENLPLFRWPNGVLELPIAQLPAADGSWSKFSFDNMDCGNQELVRDYIRRFFAAFGGKVPLPAIMHSFSFLEVNSRTRHFEYAGEGPVRAFDRYCEVLAQECRVIGQAEILRRYRQGGIVPVGTRTYDVLGVLRDGYRHAKAPSAAMTDKEAAVSGDTPSRLEAKQEGLAASEPRCGYCGTPRSAMSAYGKRVHVLCTGCGALERQRAFLEASEKWLRPEFDFAGKRILLVSPSRPELNYLRKLGAIVVTADARDTGMDHQLDICHMPQIHDESFDAAIAIAVLQHTYDDRAALSELRRVVKPGGRVILQVFHRLNSETKKLADTTQHYGAEALAKHKVGSYRIYGDRSLYRLLQAYFLVKSLHVVDPVSNTPDVIFSCLRDGE